MIRLPPRSTRTYTSCPDTTLFRSCSVVWQSGSAEAISISGTCRIGDHAGQNGKEVATRSDCAVAHLVKKDDRWKVESAGGLSYLSDNDRAKIADELASGEVSIRHVERRQVSSEERRVGKEGVSRCRSRRSTYL